MTQIIVLAGTNGAGKSSVAGAFLRASGGDYCNPDELTRELLAQNPELSESEANSRAWAINRDALAAAIESGKDYAFETTLGGRSIPALLAKAARAGIAVRMWFVGLDSVERHLERIAQRVASGGHAIPEAKVRERYRGSLLNLIELMPLLAELRVFDNSHEGDPKRGQAPAPLLVLHLVQGKMRFPASAEQLLETPDWAKPLVGRALEIDSP